MSEGQITPPAEPAGGGRAPRAGPSSRTEWQKCCPGGPVHPAQLRGRATVATDAVPGNSVGTQPPSSSRLPLPGDPKPSVKLVSCQKERADKCSAYLSGRFYVENEVKKKKVSCQSCFNTATAKGSVGLSRCSMPSHGTVRLQGEVQAPLFPLCLSLHNPSLMQISIS